MNGSLFGNKYFAKVLVYILLAYALGREALLFGLGNGV